MEQLSDALADRSALVTVIGLGYVGLPLALKVSEASFTVRGLDNDPGKVAEIRAGNSPILEVTGEEISTALERGLFSATHDPACLAEADVVVICVPTPLEQGSPNMAHINSAAQSMVQFLRPGQLVILESTTYPGTTDEFLREILESTGYKVGTDFYLGFSPERIDPGNPVYHLNNVPKVVGGVDAASGDLMESFYGTFVNKVVRVSSPKAAEMAKLLENTYRHVNIALANEMAILCHDLGIDVWEVIDAAATKPFGFEAFYPGPGWGGHCIPVDPAYLSWRVRQLGCTAKFVDLAREFNQTMPTYVFQRITEALNENDQKVKGSSILVLGVAYKPDVNDARESPAIDIIRKLRKAGAVVSYHDPYVKSLKVGDETLSSSELGPEELAGSDLVLLHTSHSAYDPQWLANHSKLIFDTRNFFKGVGGPILTL